MQLMWISSRTGDVREVKITPIKMFLVTLVGVTVSVLFGSLILFLAGFRISIDWHPPPFNRGDEKNSQNQNITPEVPLELTSLVDYRLSVSRYLENSGKYQNIEENDFIEHLCNAVEFEKSRYCTNISMATINQESGRDYVYAVESGYPLNDDGTIASYHASAGLLTFYKFQVQDRWNLKLISKSAPTFCGPFGIPCAPVLYQVGAGQELGWKVESGDMHQGYAGSHLELFAELDGKIKSILTIQTSYSNTAAFSEDEASGRTVEEIGATASLRLPTKTIFSDIEVDIQGARTVKGKKMDLSKTYILRFDSKAGRYDSKPIDDFFGDRGY